MSAPILQYERIRAVHRRRDFFGIAALLFATIHWTLFLLTDQLHIISYGWSVRVRPVAGICCIVAMGFAPIGIALLRGKSIAGWSTIGLYATALAISAIGTAIGI